MSQKAKLTGVGVVVALGLSTTALITGAIFPTEIKNQNSTTTLVYDQIAPYVKEYLATNNLVSADGMLLVPNTADVSGGTSGSTSGSASNGVDEDTVNITTNPINDALSNATKITVEEALTRLMQDGTLEYVTVKGDKGDKGDTGATGAQGAPGVNGANGADGNDLNNDGQIDNLAAGDGITYSGGVISLKPCAVDEVLMSDGTTWNCATVTADGAVNDNTTNAVASLTLNGSRLQALITDSTGNTVSSNELDLGTHFVTTGKLSDYATTAQVNSLDSRISSIEGTRGDYATKAWVEAESYLTSSGLANYLTTNGYITDTSLASTLSGYLLKNDFASTLGTHLLEGDGIDITQDSNGNSVVSSLHNAEIFVVVNDHTTVAAPDTNKIYLDTQDDPMTEWVYANGAWNKVGDLQVDLSGYSTTDQANTAINNALTNQLSDLASHSNLNTILTNYVKTGDMSAAIATAVNDMATKTWVNEQGFLTSNDLAGNATESWVASQNYATMSDLNAFYTNDEIDTMLAGKADQAALDATNVRVSTLESSVASMATSKQDKLTAGTNITINGNVISTNIDLSTYATQSWVNGQDFLMTTNADSKYTTQSWVNSQGFITNDALDGYATEDWVTAEGYLKATDLAGYAKESWVDANFMRETDVASYLTTNNYATKTDVSDAVAGADSLYVDHSEFASVLNSNLKAGSGIAIGADNTISATMFVMTTDRLTITNPDPNMIYVETGTDASSPVSQYIYLNGKDGAPTDPTQAAAWQKIGDLSGVDLSGYSTTDQMNTAINNAIAAEVAEFNKTYATQSWVDSQGYLKAASLTGYATEEYVSENYLASSALNGYATEAYVNAQGFLKSNALTGYATQSWVQGQKYLTSADLTDNATMTWVKAQSYLTTSAAASTYVTQSGLTSTLAAYQPLITGGATTITSNNLTAGMVLQSDTNGKVAASGVTIASLSTALTDIATLKSNQATALANITKLQTATQNSGSMGNYGEINTGKTFRGKPVYRQDFYLGLTANASVEINFKLMDAGIVDTVLSVGGQAKSGYGTETWGIPSASTGQYSQYHYVRLNDGGALAYISYSSSARSSADTYIIVEYTKK